MRLLFLAFLLLATSVACAENSAVVQVDEDRITISYSRMTYEFPLGHVTLRGYENIPTPTPDPEAAAQPIGTPFLTNAPHPRLRDTPPAHFDAHPSTHPGTHFDADGGRLGAGLS